MNKYILVPALAIAAVACAQVQMPATTSQGQTKTPPAKSTSSSKPAAAAAKGGAPLQGTTAEQDKQIEGAIRAKLAKSKIGKDGFTVRVQGGVATWDGTTNIVQHKGSATRMAKAAGARAVVNNIKVSDSAKQKAAENLDQGRRRAQVTRGDPRTQQ